MILISAPDWLEPFVFRIDPGENVACFQETIFTDLPFHLTMFPNTPSSLPTIGDFLVAPSLRVERLIWSLWCLYGCPYACLLNSPTKIQKSHQISKIPKWDHVSHHSEQLWFSNDPPPHPIRNFGFQEIWLDICSDRKKKFKNFWTKVKLIKIFWPFYRINWSIC